MFLAFFGFLFFSLQDALLSYTIKIYPPMQMTWLNCLTVLISVLIFLFFRKGVRGIRTVFHSNHVKLHIIRGCLLAIGSVSVIYALKFVTLPSFYSIIFIAPLLGVSLSGIFLGEPVGIGKLAALFCGFLGLLVALQPGAEHFNIYALLTLLGAVLFAIVALLSRFVGRMDTATTMIFYPMFIVVMVFLVPVLKGFVLIAPEHLLLSLGTGVCTTMAFFLNANAYRMAPLYLIAPCQFMQFLWGAIAHWILHNKIPEQHTMMGAAIIIASNAVVIYLQARAQKETSV